MNESWDFSRLLTQHFCLLLFCCCFVCLFLLTNKVTFVRRSCFSVKEEHSKCIFLLEVHELTEKEILDVCFCQLLVINNTYIKEKAEIRHQQGNRLSLSYLG